MFDKLNSLQFLIKPIPPISEYSIDLKPIKSCSMDGKSEFLIKYLDPWKVEKVL